VLPFFARLAPVRIGMEACGGSHYWARELAALGHEVVLIAPQHVKPYVRRGKHDAADAEAICEAMSRPRTRFVAAKSAARQAEQMLFVVREQLVRRRTQLANAIRGHAAEFGFVAARGLVHVEPLVARFVADEEVPALAKELLTMLVEVYRSAALRLAAIEKKLVEVYRRDATARRLAAIPGVGPVGGCLLHQGRRCGRLPLRPRLRRLAWPDAEEPFDGQQEPARRDHARRRRAAAAGSGGGGHGAPPAGAAQAGGGLALAGRAARAQATKAGRGGAGQQDRAYRLEDDGDGRGLPPW
jgi:transposase